MKARLFIVASSICLTLWMTASFFHNSDSLASNTGKVSEGNQEVPSAPIPVDSANIVTTSLRD